jgi:hypothetical protein
MQRLLFRRILKILRWAIKLAFFIEIVVAITIITLMIVVINSDEKLISVWSGFIPETAQDYVVSHSQQIETSAVSAKEIYIEFSSTGIGYYCLKFIETIFILSIVIFITYLLGRILRSLYLEHPFTEKNTKRLRIITFLVIAISPFSIISSLVYRTYISSHISIEGKTFAHSLFPKKLSQNEIWLDFQWDLEYLLLGGLLLIIVEIFLVGRELKIDNESIV